MIWFLFLISWANAQEIRVQMRDQSIQRWPLETYVAGVVAAEVPRSWPLETLKAQAVASRSYAWVKILENRHLPYDVKATIQDQVFHGQPPEPQHPVWRALSETKGRILFEGNRPLLAYFHADCGGATDSIELWQNQNPRVVAVDRGCPRTPAAQWQYSLTDQDHRRISQKVLGSELRLEGLSVRERWASGRIKSLQLRFSDGREALVPAMKFREWIGPTRIRSTRFSVALNGNLAGQGFGHGVGMCQWGSWDLGRRGASYLEILRHYYPQGRVAPLNPSPSWLWARAETKTRIGLSEENRLKAIR